jgi:glyoxylase-like metal-dependent hydrolase (beta-lactamase superfamily II)
MQVERVSDTLRKFALSLSDLPSALGVNLVASAGQDGILLVDTGWTATAEELNEQVRELGDGNVKLIIVTHPHADHYGGNGFFGKEATLIAHENGKDELSGKYFALDKLPGQELPMIALRGELSLRFNGEDIEIIPAPGHTHSDMVVYFVDSGIVCMGDLLFSDTFPGLDMSRGGDAEQYVRSIGMLLDRFPADVRLIAGHGRDYTMDDLGEYHRMVIATTELIKGGMANGKNAQDMIEEDILKDWAKWNGAELTAEGWIEQVHLSLLGQERKYVAEPLTHTIVESGIEAAIRQYHQLKSSQPDAYDFGENQLNMLGYQLMWRGRLDAAIEVFKLNTEVYPESANPFDSLGEAYAASGEKALAIENYEKALALDPGMPSAIDALEKLGSDEED